MDREPNETIDLIDLGVASVETQGAQDGDVDGLGKIPLGLSDD
ncbi:benenodin family lasso peptide [Sphingomonas canadensis]|uniref:Benenodin family lasso peptide n=1 Tax=Sphingomonas canadensis TaxID=1219257 RepID=A0ABW3HBI3_9SPHN|nr:benenodin family lasso peptide [Sphingomonas canadensis]MCW3837224.1 benenodin family lasso peptide [Sphingomonas canadensis]